MLSTRSPWEHTKEERYHPVPRNLFPKTNKQLTDEWARNTYRYFRCFDDSVPATQWEKEEDLEKWRERAILLMDEIKELGYVEAKNEIVRLANNHFKLTRVNNGQKFINVTDVVELYQNPEFYFSDLEHNRYMLYMFQYGIFRNTHNTWLLETAYRWMHAHKVVYLDPSTSKPSTKTKKGFLQELLHQKASNTIQDKFLKVCRTYLGQHLLCRDRVHRSKKTDCDYFQKLTFMNYSAYLVYDRDHEINKKVSTTDPTLKLQNSLKFVTDSGMTKDDVLKVIRDYFKADGTYKNNCVLTFMTEFY